MDLYISTIDTLLAQHEMKCRALVGTTKAAACERIAAASVNKILAATTYSGWETKTLGVVQTGLQSAGLKWAILGSMPDTDIMALAFIVLMQAAKSAQEDIKEIMDAVNDINDAKKKLRGLLQKAQEKSTNRYAPWPPIVVVA